MKKAFLIIAAGLTVGVVVLLMMISVPARPDAATTGVKTGIANKVTIYADTKDIGITLGNDSYYINRGAEHVDTASLLSAITGQTITITYYRPRFDLAGGGGHIYKVEAGGKTIYDELN